MRDEGAALYKKANMDLGDTIDAVGAPLQKGCKEETFAALAADIQKYTADAAQLTKEIAELDEDISIWQGDIDAATNVRDIEKADYDALHKACRELHSKRAAKRKPLPP